MTGLAAEEQQKRHLQRLAPMPNMPEPATALELHGAAYNCIEKNLSKKGETRLRPRRSCIDYIPWDVTLTPALRNRNLGAPGLAGVGFHEQPEGG